MNLNNPFFVRGYSGPEYFCDRKDETSKIVSSLTNEGDVTLIAPRRYGKTGLIRNVFNQIKDDQTVVYIDIYATQNLAEFTKLFVTSVVGALDTKVEKAMSVVAKFFKSCRPTVTPQEFGMPKFSFDVVPSNAEATLKEAFDYLKSREKRMVIAIDEFQQVRNYPEYSVEALLRSYIQFLPNVRFVFAGSQLHLMSDMFVSPRGPFYNSTDILSLDVIRKDVYREFAARFFGGRGKGFSDEAFDVLYDRFDGITWYVQSVLNRAWDYPDGFKSADDVFRAVHSLVENRRLVFLDLLRSQSDAQQAVLRAVAADGVVVAPTGKDFIGRHALGAASTVASVIAGLVEKELLYRTESGYIVYDRLFAEWLRG